MKGLLVCFACILWAQATLAQVPASRISVTLIGGTGDLAKKYLWQSLFEIFTENILFPEGNPNKPNEGTMGKGNTDFVFYGGARNPATTGSPDLDKILEEHIVCSDEISGCDYHKGLFVGRTSYRQLKSADHYKALCQEIDAAAKSEKIAEEGRVFYLSVPPFAYGAIVEAIDKHCRPSHPDTWIRLVLEKPFGSDLDSAQELVGVLQKNVRDSELYLMDHYLGKEVVSQTIAWRHLNQQQYEPIWNRNHVERVEVVMKEDIDVEGRAAFYDEYGVIRDVIQNHLTEVMLRVAMDLPHDKSNITEFDMLKSKCLKSIREVVPEDILTGQYATYQDHVAKEVPSQSSTQMPTFAAVRLYIDNTRWAGVPFIIMAGKALDERVGYARVIFKDQTVCLDSQMKEVGQPLASNCLPKELIFYIGHGQLKGPAILVTKSLPTPLDLELWGPPHTKLPSIHMMSIPLSHYHVSLPMPGTRVGGYDLLLRRMLQGHRPSFVSTPDLLASWAVWSKGVTHAPNPRIYESGEGSAGQLSFTFATGQPSWVQDQGQGVPTPSHEGFKAPKSLLGHPVLVDEALTVPKLLAARIADLAMDVVFNQGRHFHLALSGGKTPVPVFQALADTQGMPWHSIHVWMVDERCVPLDHDQSNFNSIQETLLKRVPISYLNIHPMPADACDSNGAKAYSLALEANLNEGKFDFVLLGMGNDGHTASLFPSDPSLEEFGLWVVPSKAPVQGLEQRLTLTLPIINRAAEVAVLVMGSGKKAIMASMLRGGADYPITRVSPVSGSMMWYTDNSVWA